MGEKSYQFQHFQGVSVFSKTRKIGDFIEEKQRISPFFVAKTGDKIKKKTRCFSYLNTLISDNQQHTQFGRFARYTVTALQFQTGLMKSPKLHYLLYIYIYINI